MCVCLKMSVTALLIVLSNRVGCSSVSPLSRVAGAALQRELHQAVVKAHEQRAVSPQDLQAPDRSDSALREDPNLLQVAALQALVGGGQSFEDGAILCNNSI